MKAIQVQGVHHITLVGSTKQSAIDFWQGALGHAVRLRAAEPREARREPPLLRSRRRPAAHGLHERVAGRRQACTRRARSAAWSTSRSTSRARRFSRRRRRLRERGIEFIQRDRGFMDSIYLHDPNGLKVELACYKFETPEGFRAVDVLMKAHELRVERGRPPHHRGARRRRDRGSACGASAPGGDGESDDLGPWGGTPGPEPRSVPPYYAGMASRTTMPVSCSLPIETYSSRSDTDRLKAIRRSRCCDSWPMKPRSRE